MAADYNEIRTALGDAMRTAVGTDLSVYDYLPAAVSAPAAVIRAQIPTGDYPQTWDSGLTQWQFEILLLIGQVSDESAQTAIGELISQKGALITALNNVVFAAGDGGGYVQVKRSTVLDMRVGSEKYTSARVTALVVA